MSSDDSGKSPSEKFVEMMKNFGSAVAEIFNDPELKEKAKDFGDSAAESAKTFASRFKDEDVKNKFKQLGSSARQFGESVSDYFKNGDEKDKSRAESSQDFTSAGTSDGDDKEKYEPASSKSPANTQEKQPDNPGDSKTNVEAAAAQSPGKGRSARITGYSFAIAWNIIFLIFFNFFNRYIAYYIYDSTSRTWEIFPVLTETFGLWLPMLNIALLITILGNIVLIINDSFYFNNITNIIMNSFGIVAAASLLVLFPFDFTLISHGLLSTIISPLIIIILIIIIIGLSVGVLVRFIKIIVKSTRIA